MNTLHHNAALRHTVLALALLAAFAPVHADDDIAQYITPQSSVSAGIAGLTGDSAERALFGQYNGMRRQDVYGVLDVNYVTRDEASALWTILEGRDLGTSSRELRFMQQRQGNWMYSADYSELERVYPRTINTGLAGVGTSTPVVTRLAARGTGSDLDLKTKRKAARLGMEKWITPNLQLEASIKSEDKDGARIFGRGFNCSATFGCVNGGGTSPVGAGAILLLPEPINSTTRQLDARLNFSTDRLFLSGAYYGSFYSNSNRALTPTFAGLLYNPNGSDLNPAVVGGNNLASPVNLMGAPIALPPDNSAHQLSLAGNYAFTPSTRATFRYAYTRAKQNENFASLGLPVAPAGVISLNGKINTTQAQAGVTARPLAKLELLANVRYDDKDDRTPLALYSPIPGLTQTDSSMRKLAGKLEASYRLTGSYRATLGVDYDMVNHGVPAPTYRPGGLNLLREETRETGYRAELRRSMSETVNGSISYTRSKRDGSGWLNAVTGTPPVTDAQAAALGNNRPVTPVMFMDRTRDKVKLSADWSPTERFSLQVYAEDADDQYEAPSNGVRKGLQETGAKLVGIDAAFTLSEAWKLSGYASRGDQSQNINHSLYLAKLTSKSDAAGLGVTGKLFGNVEVGADLSYLNDKNGYRQDVETTANTAATVATNLAFLAAQGGLPDVVYRATTLKMFGKYALNRHASLRFDLVHYRARLNEWTWGYNGAPFFYSDYSTVSMLRDQKVTMAGVTYVYQF